MKDSILILGAGVAGLAAAARLAQAGRQVILLEARDRLGGRIDTLYSPLCRVPLERGAEFVHGRPPALWNLLSAARLSTYDVPDQHRQPPASGATSPADQAPGPGGPDRQLQPANFWEKIQEVTGRFKLLKRDKDLSFLDFKKQHCQDLPPGTLQIATAYIEGFNAADERDVSVRALRLADEAAAKHGGDTLYRVTEGYGRLVAHMAAAWPLERVDVRLQRRVVKVQWKKHRVSFTARTALGETETYNGRAAILSLPAGILQTPRGAPGHVAFDPPLPAPHRKALSFVRMGAVIKILIQFARPFWEDADADLNFLHARNAKTPFPTWWNTLSVRSGLLTGWCGGSVAQRISRQTDTALARQAIARLAALAGRSARDIAGEIVQMHCCNWQRDPFARGAYSYLAVGGADAPQALAEPMRGTLFLAGEAIHQGMSGTVAGAIESGQLAAERVLSAE